MKNDMKIAVLIDADNVSDKYIKYIFDEISNLGMPTFKRIYGDWTKPQLGSWKTVLLNYSITPIQQYSYTTGKNATDAALIIDAMDILYSNNVDGFCIVSSDSDFTRLATRLREAGMYVVGMGEKKTPTPFISACEKFKYLEVLAADPDSSQPETVLNQKQTATKAGMTPQKQLIQSIKTIINENSDEEGWADLGLVGSRLNNRYPDFDSRNYGYSKLRSLLSSLDKFELTTRRTNNSQNVKYVIRNIISEKNGSGQKDVQLKKELNQSFQAIISDNADPSGWANLGLVGSQIAQKHPTFKSKNYGYAKLRSLLEALNLFDIEVRKTSNSKNPEALIRNKTLTKVKNAGL